MTNQPVTDELQRPDLATGTPVFVTKAQSYQSEFPGIPDLKLMAYVTGKITSTTIDLKTGTPLFSVTPEHRPHFSAWCKADDLQPVQKVAPFNVQDILGESPYPYEPSKHNVYTVIAGSRGYGMHTDQSDYDIRGIYQLDDAAYHSLVTSPEQIHTPSTTESGLEIDSQMWELRHFVLQALKANPAALEMLYLPDWSGNETGKALRAQREMFLSKHIYMTFGKYAESQFTRLMRARLQGHEIKPKMAMHLLRLLMQGAALLLGYDMLGPTTAWREDLLAVKRGEWSWEKIDQRRELLTNHLNLAFARTTLPDQPDVAGAESFIQACYNHKP